MTNVDLSKMMELTVGQLSTEPYRDPLPRIELANGITLSVQAGTWNYCQPRENLPRMSDYSEFEIGFPSERIEALMPYVEDATRPTGTVYAYVPKEVLLAIVADAGGVVGFAND